MANTKKSFFRERTVAEIKQLATVDTVRQKGLIALLDEIDPTEAVVLRAQLIPGRFYAGNLTGEEAAKKCYKHGEFLGLTQPKTREEAYRLKEIPLALRQKDFASLEVMNEEEINLQGYSWHPVQGNDRRKRVVPFVWLPEAARLFAYAESMAPFLDEEGNPRKGIQVKAYDDAARVKIEGAKVLCSVPSRTAKKPRYNVRLDSVPVEGNTERRAIIWSLKSAFDMPPEHNQFNMRYTYETDREGSDVHTFYPHDIAAYVATAADFWKKHNLTVMEMNPFALPSRHQAEFYKKLCNNLLVFDPTQASKDRLRKPYLAEKSILLARAIGKFGAEDFAFWDPERDGKLKDYDWLIE